MNNISIDTLKQLRREYLKSYYSINTYIGCTINCGYCFLAPIKIVPMRPIKVIDEEILVNEMLEDPLFELGKTIISINNRTDPFISIEVKKSTMLLLDIMNKKKITNPITITTKGLVDLNDVKVIESYKDLNVIIIVTYNGIPETIQPISSKVQETTMRNIGKSNIITLLHQFRPIIPNVNDDERTINSVLDYASQYCKATIYQGLRINEYIDTRLKEREYFYKGKYDKHKQKSENIDLIFRNQQSKRTYPIFDHTSCAISFLHQEADYNQHYMKKKCNKNLCMNYANCQKRVISTDMMELAEMLKRIGITCGWHMKGDVIVIEGEINDEQKSFIRHILHRNVSALKREYSFSETLMD